MVACKRLFITCPEISYKWKFIKKFKFVYASQVILCITKQSARHLNCWSCNVIGQIGDEHYMPSSVSMSSNMPMIRQCHKGRRNNYTIFQDLTSQYSNILLLYSLEGQIITLSSHIHVSSDYQPLTITRILTYRQFSYFDQSVQSNNFLQKYPKYALCL